MQISLEIDRTKWSPEDPETAKGARRKDQKNKTIKRCQSHANEDDDDAAAVYVMMRLVTIPARIHNPRSASLCKLSSNDTESRHHRPPIVLTSQTEHAGWSSSHHRNEDKEASLQVDHHAN